MNHPRAEKSSWGCRCQQCERIVIFIWKRSWLQQTQKWFSFKGNHRMRRTLKNKSISRGPPSKYNTLCVAVREIRKVSVMTGISAQAIPIQRFLLRRCFMENSAFAFLELTWRNCSVVSSTWKRPLSVMQLKKITSCKKGLAIFEICFAFETLSFQCKTLSDPFFCKETCLETLGRVNTCMRVNQADTNWSLSDYI